jgi:1-aminocyclopropane-1-carboxylate deaminase/D-cysteine desulfhydrase-like pyridoxal-dependent ACC family enzyme
MIAINENNIPLVEISDAILESKNTRLFILREDLTHPEISGNKWRKLKYNIQEAKKLNHKTLLTFGGAYSNHIAATAAAGREYGIKTIGVIRGEETLPLNSTLQLAKDNGMVFKYVSRTQYRENNKYEKSFIESLTLEFGDFYLVPEGGSNTLAVKGCTEIKNNINIVYDIICSACGTGGTLAGIIASSEKRVLGFPALKGGEFLKKDISRLLNEYSSHYNVNKDYKNWDLITDYHFGGYAKVKPELIQFVQEFHQKHQIELDLIYTGKMLFGLYDLIQTTSSFNGKTIVVVHTGGLQGNLGFEEQCGIQLFS